VILKYQGKRQVNKRVKGTSYIKKTPDDLLDLGLIRATM